MNQASTQKTIASFSRFPLAVLGAICFFPWTAVGQTKVLIDFGRDNTNGIRTLSTPGNWNSINSSAYWAKPADKNGVPTTLDLGFEAGAIGSFDSISGPAGDTSATGSPNFSGFNSNSVTNTSVDVSLLGDLAAKEAAFDYVTSSVFVMNELNPRRTYKLTFFGSHKK